MKLHLGCGTKKIEGYCNIDCRDTAAVDVVDDVSVLSKFADGTADVVYASHVLEHFSRHKYKEVLKRWHDVLKEGGILRIAVPDFEQIAKYYLETGDLRAVSGILYGGQDYPENNHFWCWDFEQLKKDLKEVGFNVIVRYEWQQTEHSDVDDFSQAYLPHMDKENGTLMSLNVEAKK